MLRRSVNGRYALGTHFLTRPDVLFPPYGPLTSGALSEAHLETVTDCLSCSLRLSFTRPTCVMAHTYVRGALSNQLCGGIQDITWRHADPAKLTAAPTSKVVFRDEETPPGVLRGRLTEVIQLPVLTFQNKDALSLLPPPKASLFPYPLTSPGPIHTAYPSANRLTTSCYSIILGSSGTSPN